MRTHRELYDFGEGSLGIEDEHGLIIDRHEEEEPERPPAGDPLADAGMSFEAGVVE